MLQISNANDTVGKPLGFGNVMFSQNEVAPVTPLFVAPVSQPVAIAA